ncbi:MAG: hypothetical protein HC908_11875 [Calothrix sp. SM1_7_51]|nr:hypothetical protein [Calothrix sp. SM1_7_51]
MAISVQNTRDFNRQLLQGLEKYININLATASEAEQDDLGYILEDLERDKNSDFYRLQKIVDSETLGKLKKQAQINYLEFLLENVDTDNSQSNAENAIYLQDLIRRLKLIEEYIGNSTKADGDYLVYYAGTEVNYKDMFSRGEAYEILPIIPIIDGYLGEEKDEVKGEIQFVFGIKLKFDGKVQALGGKNVFEYHLNLLNPDSEEHKAGLANEATKDIFVRKVLKIAFLYYFVFASLQNAEDSNYNPAKELEYNPLDAFEQLMTVTLKGNDEVAKQELFRNIYMYLQKLKVKIKINKLKGLLQRLLKRQTHFPTREYPLHISIKNGILEVNINNILTKNTFFKDSVRGNPKENLKYISLGKAQTQTDSLCSLPAKITISDIRFFVTDDRQNFSMEYDLQRIKSLPILFVNLKDSNCYKIYTDHFSKQKLILFSYCHKTNNFDSIKAFVHQFTYSLLAYTCLHILLQKDYLFPF